MKSRIAIAGTLFIVSSCLFVGLCAAEDGAWTADQILPSETIFYMGIDDYALFEKYLASMPMEKIVNEEEVVDFLQKPKDYMNSKMAELKAMVAAQDEKMAAELEKLMGLKLSRFFFAVTHLTFPPMGEGMGEPIPDLGITVGVGLEGGADPAFMVKNFAMSLLKPQGVEVVFEAGAYNEVAFEILKVPGVPFGLYFFKLGDVSIFTLSEKTMKSMVDLSKGTSKDSLVNHGDYKQLSSEITLDKAGSVNSYVNVKGFLDFAAESLKLALLMEGEEEFVGKIDVVKAKLGLDGLGGVLSRALSKDGVARSEATTHFRGDMTGIMKIVPQIPFSEKELAAIPKNAVSCSGFRIDLAAIYDVVMDMVKTMDEETYQQAQAGLNGFSAMLTGAEATEPFDLRNDLLGPLGSGMIFYSVGGSSGAMMAPGGFNILVEVKDYDKLVGSLMKIFDGLSNFDPSIASKITFSSIDFDGQTISYFQFPEMPLVTPCFTKLGNFLAFGLQLDDVKKMIKRKGTSEGSIFDKEDFSKLYEKLVQGAPLMTFSYTETKKVFSDTYNGVAMSLPMMTMMIPPEIDLPIDFQLLPTADCIESHLFSSMTVNVMPEKGHYKTLSYGPFGAEMINYLFPTLATIGFFGVDYYLTHELGMGDSVGMGGQFAEPVVDEGSLAEDQVRSDMTGLVNGCFVFKIEHDKYPAKLTDLLVPTDDWPTGFYTGKELPKDPWGNPYYYKQMDGGEYSYMIWSAGPNATDEGGAGDDIVRKK